MTKKTRTRLNRTLAHLRKADELLGGVSLADGVAVFESCRLVKANVSDLIKQMAPTPAAG